MVLTDSSTPCYGADLTCYLLPALIRTASMVLSQVAGFLIILFVPATPPHFAMNDDISPRDATAYCEIAATGMGAGEPSSAPNSRLTCDVVLFCYDYMLTLSQEISTVWQRRFSGATVIYLLSRYTVLVNRLVRLVQVVSWRGFEEAQADLVST